MRLLSEKKAKRNKINSFYKFYFRKTFLEKGVSFLFLKSLPPYKYYSYENKTVKKSVWGTLFRFYREGYARGKSKFLI